MSRIAYVNGRYTPVAKAGVSILDRGLQFSDSVYEVWAVRGARLVDDRAHQARLARSLTALSMRPPMPAIALSTVVKEVVRQNRVRDGLAYLQVTRGAARRDHVFPPADTPSTIIATAQSVDMSALKVRQERGVGVITHADERWARRDIKSTSLLANVLARQAAREQSAAEAWLIDADGDITEGAATTAWIVRPDGVVQTRRLSRDVLPGVTRSGLMETMRAHQIACVELAFGIEDVRRAAEAFMTSASAGVMPVIALDGAQIGSGGPGPLTQRLGALYWQSREFS